VNGSARRSSPPALGSALPGRLSCLAVYTSSPMLSVPPPPGRRRQSTIHPAALSHSPAALTAPSAAYRFHVGPDESRRSVYTTASNSPGAIDDADVDVEYLADSSRPSISPLKPREMPGPLHRRRDSSTLMQAEAVEPLSLLRVSMAPMKEIPLPSTVQVKRFLQSWYQRAESTIQLIRKVPRETIRQETNTTIVTTAESS